MRTAAEVAATLTLPWEPKPKQLEVADTARTCPRFALFSDVGTGKTLMSTLTAKIWDDDQVLVTGPPILSGEWEKWLRAIGETSVQVYAGPKRKPEDLDEKWVIMSHAIFRNDATKILERFRDRKVTLIVDEAQALKNPKSVLNKRVMSFISPDKHALLLTATPTSKHEDTYAYMKIKTPDMYRSYGQWCNIHVADVDIFGNVSAYRELELLRDNFSRNAIKMTKKDVFGDMPDPIFHPIEYKLSKDHYDLYKRLAEEQLLINTENGEKIDATTAQRLRHKLQQIIVNYDTFAFDPSKRSATFDIMDELIDQIGPMNENNSKFVVWTWYKATSAKITKYLKEKFGDEYVVAAYGDVDSKKSVHEIMHGRARFGVFQPTSVGAGLNLQHVCSEMFFAEMSTTPMHMRQAIGRVDRFGARDIPTIHFGIAQDTVQVGLYENLLRNDESVSFVERNLESLRSMIYGAHVE